jgi:hypothetical protein
MQLNRQAVLMIGEEKNLTHSADDVSVGALELDKGGSVAPDQRERR